MTTDRNEDRKYAWFTCGKCGHENYRLKSEEEEDCVECGAVMTGTTSSDSNTTTGGASDGGDLSKTKQYMHRSRSNHDIPSEIKLDLAKPTQKPSGY